MNKLSNIVEYTSEEDRKEHKFSPDTIKESVTLDLYKSNNNNKNDNYKAYNNFEQYSSIDKKTSKTKDDIKVKFNNDEMNNILKDMNHSDSEDTNKDVKKSDLAATNQDIAIDKESSVCKPCPPCEPRVDIFHKKLFNISSLALLICILIITLMSSKKMKLKY